MTPPLWQFAILALAAYRLTRLCGWDEFPLAAKVRAWVTGEEWVEGEKPTLPGKTPDTDFENVRVAYQRPVLAHLIHCPFCLGWWVSLLTAVAWWTSGSPGGHNLGWAGWVAFPLALSGAVGLLSKNLDK